MRKSIKWLSAYNFTSKKVLMRVDLNVPIVNGMLLDDTRIKAIQSSIRHLQDNKIILLTHLGQPTSESYQYSTVQLVPFLQKILDRQVNFVKDIEEVGEEDLFLLENVRFKPQEKQNDPVFAQNMAKYVDVFVNEAFSCSHRKHASIIQFPRFLESYGGLHFEEEIKMLSIKLQKPLLLIVGGAKVKSKLEAIEGLITQADIVFFGGVTANTFLKAKGVDIGHSRYDEKALDQAKVLLKRHDNIILPIDVKSKDGIFDVFTSQYDMILDIGSKTVDMIEDIVKKVKSIVWSGPLGLIEQDLYAQGSLGVSRIIQKYQPLHVIIGGGDTLSILNETKTDVSYASTGGGAMLYYLAKHTLPGLESLKGY